MSLSKTGIGQSQIERTRQHLAALETQAQARISAAEARSEITVSKRLHIAQLYRDSTQSRHAEALKCYRVAQERLAADPGPRRGLADRILGRQPVITGMDPLECDLDNARTDLIAAEKAAAGADGNLARVEKIEAAERTQRMGQMEMERRTAMAMLGEAVMARRIATAFPAFMFCGPLFTAWAGSKVERKRVRGLWNPWAVNLWGIPIDFG